MGTAAALRFRNLAKTEQARTRLRPSPRSTAVTDQRHTRTDVVRCRRWRLARGYAALRLAPSSGPFSQDLLLTPCFLPA